MVTEYPRLTDEDFIFAYFSHRWRTQTSAVKCNSLHHISLFSKATMTDDKLWRENLETKRDQLVALAASERLGCVSGVFSPDPIRRDDPHWDASDFNELFQLSLCEFKYCTEVIGNRYRLEALYPFMMKNAGGTSRSGGWQDFPSLYNNKYTGIANDLLRLIFGDAATAEHCLGLQEGVSLAPRELWTIVLFRLAALKIDNLTCTDQLQSEHTFQTVWPQIRQEDDEVEGLYESLKLSPDSDSPVLYSPYPYVGSVAILHEATGMLRADSTEESKTGNCEIECTLQFSPPLTLFVPSHRANGSDSTLPFALSRFGTLPPRVTIRRNDNETILVDSRIVSLCCFAHGDENSCENRENRSEVTFHILATSRLHVWTRRLAFCPARHEEQNIPLHISLTFDGGLNSSAIPQSIESESARLKIDLNESFMPNGTTSNFHLVPLATGSLAERDAEIIRLDEAERMLSAIESGGEFHIQGIGRTHGWLPKQRITNIVQVIDDLFDASAKAVDLTLVKGKEWFRQVIERTAPYFNAVWEDGIFTIKKKNELLSVFSRLQESCISIHSKSLEEKPIPSAAGPTKKKRCRFTKEEWKKIIDLALLFLRIDPTIPSNEKLAALVSKVYSGVAGSDFSKDDGKNPDDLNFFKKTAKNIRSSAKHENLSDSVNESADEKCSTDDKQKKLKGREPDPALEVELDEELKFFCRREGLPLMSREELIKVCIAQPELAEKLGNFLKS